MAVGLINVSPNDTTGNFPGFGNAALDHFGQFAEVRVTWRQFRPRVTNADDRFTAEFLIGFALVFHPGAVNESVFAGFAEPILTAELDFIETICSKNTHLRSLPLSKSGLELVLD
jgi:hypothetical protein